MPDDRKSTTSGTKTQQRGPLSAQGSQFQDLLTQGVQTALGGAPSEALSGIPTSFGALNEQFATALQTGELPNNIFGPVLSDFKTNIGGQRTQLMERLARQGLLGTPQGERLLSDFETRAGSAQSTLAGNFLQNFLSQSGSSLTNIFNAQNQTLGLGLQGAAGGLNAAIQQAPLTTAGTSTTTGGGNLLQDAAAVAELAKLLPAAKLGIESLFGLGTKAPVPTGTIPGTVGGGIQASQLAQTPAAGVSQAGLPAGGGIAPAVSTALAPGIAGPQVPLAAGEGLSSAQLAEALSSFAGPSTATALAPGIAGPAAALSAGSTPFVAAGPNLLSLAGSGLPGTGAAAAATPLAAFAAPAAIGAAGAISAFQPGTPLGALAGQKKEKFSPAEKGEANITFNTQYNDLLSSLGLEALDVGAQNAATGKDITEQRIRAAFASGQLTEQQATDALSQLQIDLFDVQ